MSLPVLKDPTRIKQAWEVLNQLCENQHLLPSQDWLRVDEARKVVADWYVRLVSGAVAALLTLFLVVPAAAVPIADNPPEPFWGVPISLLVPMTVFPTITVLAPVYALPLELPAGVSLGSPSWSSAEPAELIANPEPGTLLLVGTTLLALGRAWHRRRR